MPAAAFGLPCVRCAHVEGEGGARAVAEGVEAAAALRE